MMRHRWKTDCRIQNITDIRVDENGTFYAIEKVKQNDNTWFFGFTGTDTSKDISLKTLDDVMNYEIDGERLVDICTKFTVIERTF